MFLALRELIYARSRFTLMGSVVALISVLMVLLAGLSSGLVNDGVSGLQRMPVQAVAFAPETRTDSAFTRSVVGPDQVARWAARPDVAEATPMGLSIINAKNSTGTPVDLTLIGADLQGPLIPEIAEGRAPATDGEILVSATAADAVDLGDTVTVDRLGIPLEVVGIAADQHTFGHVDMAFTTLATWQDVHAGTRVGEEPRAGAREEYSVVAITGVDGELPDLATGDADADTSARTLEEAFDSSPGYEAEMMTVSMITWFLYAISALVVGAFFAILTVQRSREIAVLRAMGASTIRLLIDAVGQAFILLTGSIAVGVAIGVGVGSFLVGTGMPFALEAGPIALGAALLLVLGLVGATLATVRITSVDPHSALGENR
ncbi:FtsX-like permease family protein [Dietzia psychralcaliphila]|uniref:ABC transporter permease n=1 Tax=Dietzia psychralcaliphila TaxID=139021 RepID=A0AAD0JTD5_9ACTN|nr:ABC transporter permease [Dietzia psychralcaliphila]AWH95228.1 ABC transporter permease [Dietzia psychralcaliphila]PTM87476.1 putative ABC transport system permease protein [Dietzia psychralcaliphila]